MTTINGNLTIQSTSTREFRLTGNTTFTLNLAGNLAISGGVLNLASGSGAPTINIGGNFNQTGGTFTSSSSVSTVVFTGGSSASVTFATSGGTFTNTNINWQIAAGKTVGLNTNFGGGSWVNAARTMTVNGAFQINQGAWPENFGAWSYSQSTGTLIYNNSSGSYGVGNDNYWPAANGPFNVTVQGAGGITMNVARTVNGLFQTAATVTNANNLTLNGTAQINAGGYFASSPVYGPASTLVYNTGGSYNIANEWIVGAVAGSGVPRNVTIQNNTAVVLPNGAGTRTVPGDFTLTSGSLTLGGNIGDDLDIKGNWINNGGTLNANSRAVTFNGSAAQSIGGTSPTTFDYLTINNAAGVTLNTSATVNNQLMLTAGDITTGANTLTLAEAATTSGGGDVWGNTKRTGTLATAKTYGFGNPNVSLNFASGTLPTDVTINLAGSQPANFGNYAVNRSYSITPNGGSGYSATVRLHYRDAELNSNAEGNLVLWRWDGSAWQPVGASNRDASDNWVEQSGVTAFSSWALSVYGPTAVELRSLTATAGDSAVTLAWDTVSEVNTVGFNVYRDVSEAGPGNQLNAALIPAQGLGSPRGYHYSYLDSADLVPGTTYYYWLEDISTTGAATRHSPISVLYTGAPTAVGLAGFGGVPGLPAAWPAAGLLLTALGAAGMARRRKA